MDGRSGLSPRLQALPTHVLEVTGPVNVRRTKRGSGIIEFEGAGRVWRILLEPGLRAKPLRHRQMLKEGVLRG